MPEVASLNFNTSRRHRRDCAMNSNAKYVWSVVIALAAIGAQLPAHALDPNSEALVGHWRKTTIVYTGPRDEHLVLRANGAAERWAVTAQSRTPVATGIWQAEGKVLTVQIQGQQEISLPFTFYQGQLVFPNIQNRRGFWEKIAR
jgi:hypothetical protein